MTEHDVLQDYFCNGNGTTYSEIDSITDESEEECSDEVARELDLLARERMLDNNHLQTVPVDDDDG